MASSSNPPQFLLDDQTDDDEDFFDKLVDDSYSPTQAQAQAASSSSLKFDEDEDGSDSDVTKAAAIANLDGDVQLNESANPEGPSSSMWKEETSSESAIANLSLGGGDGDVQLNESANTRGSEGPSKEETSSLPMEETKLGDDDVVVRSSDQPLILSETVKESGSPGVKEVDWGSFCAADSSVNDGAAGFGSYSDFFTELEGSAVDAGNLVSNDAQNNASFGFDSSAGLGKHHQDVVSQNSTSAGNFVSNETKNNASFGFEQHQGEVSQNSTSEQYVDNSQAWENSYPGWKYDANTGQWYQVDTHDASVNAQESYINSASNWESGSVASNDVAYLRQSTTSAVAGTAESMSTWNQVSQVGNGYPEHMVLDPQYPGWYYDTIAQEWRSLDSYNQASQTTATSQAHDQQAQNVHALGALYHNNTTDSNIYNVNDKSQAFQAHEQQAQNAQAFGAMFHNNTESSMYNINDKSQAFKAQDFGIQNQQGSWDQSYYANNQQQEATNTWQSERSPDGRPPHPLVSFGFGGKLIVLKDSNGSLQNSSFGSQGAGGSSISVLNLAEVTSGSASFSSLGKDSSSYFRSLHQQCLPGPLVGGSVGSKDLIKWLDERILQCESSDIDFSRGKLLKMLLSLLRISCQYYGKLRSPFGADTTQKETDSVEAAVAKLFAFAKNNGVQNGGYAPLIQCLQHLPPESQMQATASEVQNLLAFGRKMEALQCAQEGHLWGPALVIAAQLGDQFYADTVKQMALRQLVPGSPLRTLCLLVAGQPAEVFSNGSTSCVNFPGSVSASQHQTQFGSSNMLDNWEENLGIITANRTTDDELVITHLGDCMWKERSEIIAAHICYLIADKNFDPYSDSARLCLVGADHWKYPRTYASPEAIQRTEVYEYSKTLGNSQYILLPFQPYKIIYAHMLAEVGKLSAAQKYCQAVSKCLKTGRSTEVETWKQFVSSLEERIRIHQQGGYTVNSSPAKIVGKLLNFFDSTAHRVVGGMPPPAPHSTTGNLQANGYQHQQQEATKLPYSQSANTMQSLMSQASMEPIRERGGNARTMAGHSRSVSEPDFGRTPLQYQPDSSKDKATDGVPQVKSTANVTSSRFGSFGFGILRNTVRRVLPSRPSKEAKLGDENQFYYDEKLKRWVEKGVEPPAEEAALPPPPTVGTYRSNSLGYENKSDMKNEMSPPSGSLTGIPPISQGSNQFSARGRPRSRYVDTYNPGSGNSQTMFQSAHAKSAKPPIPSKASFFIPAAPANDQVTEMAAAETRQEYSAEEVAVSAGAPTPSAPSHSSFQSPAPSPMTRQRFPSLDNINGNVLVTSLNGDFPPPSGSRRTASWSGSLNNSFTSPTGPSNLKPSPLNGSSSGSLGEELQEVEL